jgi:hypothetical protein
VATVYEWAATNLAKKMAMLEFNKRVAPDWGQKKYRAIKKPSGFPKGH